MLTFVNQITLYPNYFFMTLEEVNNAAKVMINILIPIIHYKNKYSLNIFYVHSTWLG